jgi:hypothetical protein
MIRNWLRRRRERRQAAALRQRFAATRERSAATDAMLARRTGRNPQ